MHILLFEIPLSDFCTRIHTIWFGLNDTNNIAHTDTNTIQSTLYTYYYYYIAIKEKQGERNIESYDGDGGRRQRWKWRRRRREYWWKSDRVKGKQWRNHALAHTHCVHSETEHLIYDISKLDGLLKHITFVRAFWHCADWKRSFYWILLVNLFPIVLNVKREKNANTKERTNEKRKTHEERFKCNLYAKWEINHRVRIFLRLLLCHFALANDWLTGYKCKIDDEEKCSEILN